MNKFKFGRIMLDEILEKQLNRLRVLRVRKELCQEPLDRPVLRSKKSNSIIFKWQRTCLGMFYCSRNFRAYIRFSEKLTFSAA